MIVSSSLVAVLSGVVALASAPTPEDEPSIVAPAVVTGFAVASSALAIGLVAGGFEATRAHALEPCEEGCLFFDDVALYFVGTMTTVHTVGLSAVAGDLWSRRHAALARSHRRRAIASVTVGTLALAAGSGLYIAGFMVHGDCDEVSRACENGMAARSIALTSVGALAMHLGGGLLGYGGTTLRLQPNVTASRHGATLGLTLAF